MNHDIKGCKDVGQCGSNHPFVPEGNLFWKLINITFAYLLESTILQNLKKKNYTVSKFGSKWVQIAHFPQEIFYGKIGYHFSVPIVFHLTTTFQKNLREQIIRQGSITLAQIGLELPCPPKGNLFETLATIALVFYIPLCFIISKKFCESRS